MSTINGFGTMYYGWRHDADGTATATQWACAFWLPLIPLRRQRLRIASNLERPALRAHLGGLAVSQTDVYELLETTPLQPLELASTACKTYLGLPALLIGPILLAGLVLLAARRLGLDATPGSPAFMAYVGLGFLGLLNFLLQAVRAIRRARGWQPRVQAPVRS